MDKFKEKVHSKKTTVLMSSKVGTIFVCNLFLRKNPMVAPSLVLASLLVRISFPSSSENDKKSQSCGVTVLQAPFLSHSDQFTSLH